MVAEDCESDGGDQLDYSRRFSFLRLGSSLLVQDNTAASSVDKRMHERTQIHFSNSFFCISLVQARRTNTYYNRKIQAHLPIHP